MNRIDQLFQEKSDVLTLYFTAGYPQLNDTLTIIESMAANGADMIEIGLPFSDPLADGPTIQETSRIALENGMSTETLFTQLEGIREKVSVPLVIMGNLNPVLQYGVEKFCARCAEVGIDGLILPDLPPDLYASEYKALFDQYGLHFVLLVTPETSAERIRYIDELSSGFVYLVSSSSTTGGTSGFGAEHLSYFERIKQMGLNTPTQIGFGISSHASYRTVCDYANGAIIGSAFLKAIANAEDLKSASAAFVQSILKREGETV
jgi:tryptophan synthase alpha chain